MGVFFEHSTRNMKNLEKVLSPVARLWERFNEFLHARAQQEVNAWGSSLQYKRRYTNPDSAKAARQPN